MIQLKQKPSEELIEFIFYGFFNPDQYSTEWLIRRGIIHKKQKNEFVNIRAVEGSMKYSTEFIHFNITESNFSISTHDILYFDVLLEMVKSIIGVVRRDFKDSFTLKFNRHFRLKSAGKVRKGLNQNVLLDNWQDIFGEPKVGGIYLFNDSKQKDFSFRQSLAISPCERESGSKDIHIFVKNRIILENIVKFQKFDEGLFKIVDKTQRVTEQTLEKFK